MTDEQIIEERIRICNQLNDTRIAKRMSIADLSERCDIFPTKLIRALSGKYNVNLSTIIVIARALEMETNFE